MKPFSVFLTRRAGTAEPIKTTPSAYYLKLARKIKFVKFSYALFIVLFLLYAFTVNKNEMTISNLRYMLKYINITSAETASPTSTVVFDHDDKSAIALLRDNTVVVDGSGISVYDIGNQRTLHTSFSFTNPGVVTTESLIFAYDLGGGSNTLKIFNTYAELYSFEYDSAIYGVSVNSDGAFCVIAADSGYSSGIKVYSKDDLLIYSKQFGNTHIVSASISSKADHVLTVTLGADDGDYLCTVYRYATSYEDEVNTLKFRGEMPLRAAYLENDSFIFLTDSALRFYGEDCTLKNTVSFDNLSVKRYFFGEDYAIITCATQIVGNSTQLMAYDSEGNETFVSSFDGDVLCAKQHSGKLYVLCSGELHCFNINTGEDTVTQLDKSYDSIEVSEEYIACVCETGSLVISTVTEA